MPKSKLFLLLSVASVTLIALAAFVFVPIGEVDSCLDGGGYWNKENRSCNCSYADTGYYAQEPEIDQLKERARCDSLSRMWEEEQAQCKQNGGQWDVSIKLCKPK